MYLLSLYVTFGPLVIFGAADVVDSANVAVVGALVVFGGLLFVVLVIVEVLVAVVDDGVVVTLFLLSISAVPVDCITLLVVLDISVSISLFSSF